MGGTDNCKLSPEFVLEPGDIIVSTDTRESGLLVRKDNLFDGIPLNEHDLPAIQIWRILWAGKIHSKYGSQYRIQAYTEEGLKNMISEGLFTLYKNN